MFVKRFHYIFIQTITVLAAVIGACVSPKPHASPSPTPAGPPVPTAQSVKSVSPEVRSVAESERASFVAEVDFKPKSFDLTPAAQRRIETLLSRARKAGRIEKIHMIVWADHEYPSIKRRTLPADEIRLADRRAKAVNDFLKERSPDAITDAFNMAERPSAVQSVLSTTDARIKRSLELAGIPTTAGDIRTAEFAAKTFVLVLLAE